MINLKEHFRLSAIYTFFAAFPALLQLIVYPIIEGETRLGAADFGHLAITEAIISMVFLVCTFGMGSGITRFYYEYKDNKKDYNKLVSTIISGILGRGMLLLGATLIFAPFIGQLFNEPALQNYNDYGPSLVISGLNRSILVTLLALYRNEKRLRIFVLVSLLSGLLRSGFQLTGVFFYDMSFLGYVHGTAVGSSFVAIAIVVFTYINCGFHYDNGIRKPLLSFVTPLFFSDLILWGLLFADRFFLLNNASELGIYDNAMKFAIGIQLIIQGLTNAIQPEIFRYLKEGTESGIKNIKTLSNLLIAESTGIILLTIIPVMLFIAIFYKTELTMSSGLVTIVFARFILTSQYKIFAIPLMYAKKTHLFLYINTGALLLNLLLNWILTPVIGYYGAITAFMVAFSFQVILFSILQRRYIPIDWNRYKVFYFPMAVVLAAILQEVVKLVLNADPFITTGTFVLLSFGWLAGLYSREILSILNIRKSR